MVERALADAQALAEPIDAEAVRAIVSNGCQADLNPIRLPQHSWNVPYGMVWSREGCDRDRRWFGRARGSHHGRRGRCFGHAARIPPNARRSVALNPRAKES